MADGSATADNALAVARDVLKRAPLFDGHNDLAWVIRIDSAARGDVVAYDLTRVHERADTDIPRLREGMVGAQFWAAFQPTNAPHPARTTLEQIDLIRRIEEAHPDVFLPARQAADYARAKSVGKIASFIAVEGGVGLENSLSPLRIWHAAGVRLMTLCHNETLDWVDSATDAPRNGGLNAFGRAVVGELNRLGIVIDLAHTSHEAHAPGARRDRSAGGFVAFQRLFALRPSAQHARRRSQAAQGQRRPGDGDFRARLRLAAAARLAAPFARSSWQGAAAPRIPRPSSPSLEAKHGSAPKASLEQVADHIVRLVETAGLDHVGIGSDYFGGASPVGLEDVSRFPHLFAELVRRGFSERDLEKMSSKNMLRVLRRVETVGKSLRKTRPPAIGRLEDYRDP